MIRVKFLSKVALREWTRCFPDDRLILGNCQFVFDPQERNYDWLVVYDDFTIGNRGSDAAASELLGCPREQTLLVTTEPSSIKCYGTAYTAQFGFVLTSQEPWSLPHPNRLYSQPGLRWFYGIGKHHARNLNELLNAPVPEKTKLISAASSSKQQRHTLHHARYHFVQSLSQALPELDVFGHGIRAMDDKAEAVDPYCYHVAIENHIGLHHWTEKLADAFLGFALPLYAGAPNTADYFPPESFISIDLKDTAESVRMIRDTVHSGDYSRRLPFIREARHLILTEYGLMGMLSRHISSIGLSYGNTGSTVHSRHALRKSSPLIAIRDLAEKTGHRVRRKLNKLQG